MNTYTDTMNSKKKAHQSARNSLFSHTAILAVIVTLVLAVATGVFIANRSAAAAEDARAVPYSNALEMQYAQPWLQAQNRPAPVYSNALELQYAQPWIDAQNKPAVTYSNALELQYAQPWLEAENRPAVTYSNALEMQYAQPWLNKAEQFIVVTGNAQGQVPLNCSSSIEMLYACKFGYGLP